MSEKKNPLGSSTEHRDARPLRGPKLLSPLAHAISEASVPTWTRRQALLGGKDVAPPPDGGCGWDQRDPRWWLPATLTWSLLEDPASSMARGDSRAAVTPVRCGQGIVGRKYRLCEEVTLFPGFPQQQRELNVINQQAGGGWVTSLQTFRGRGPCTPP